MAFHDRRPVMDTDEEPVVTEEEEGTPAVETENNVPDEPSEESDEVVVSSEETEKEADDIEPVEEPKKSKALDEPLENLEEKKAKLLKELVELRNERRGLKTTPFQEQKKDAPLFVEDDPLKDVAAQDVDLIEKVLKAKGYVKKDELSANDYSKEIKSYTNSWLENNPEFKPENDPDDENWNKLNTYATKFFNKPADPRDVLEILDAARDRLFGKKTASLPTKSLNSVAAKKEKIAISAKPSSGGSSSSKSNSSGNVVIDNSKLQYLKGFSDEELKEIATS